MTISNWLSDCIRHVTAVDERIVRLRHKHTCGFVSAMAVYESTEEASLEDKERFYFRLNSMIWRCLAGYVLVLGDFGDRQ